MKILYATLLVGILGWGSLLQAQVPDSAAIVTRLGHDTLAVERWVRTTSTMKAEVLLRAPALTQRVYQLDLQPDGALKGWSQEVYSGRDTSWSGTPDLLETVELHGDSIKVIRSQEGETQIRTFAGHAWVLPFFDMIHWPFELMLMRAHASGRVTMQQDLFTGRGIRPFMIGTQEPGKMTVTHPTRGTMTVEVDPLGRLQSLDASETTRKLSVTRQDWIALEPLLADFAGRKPFGALSGRGSFEGTIQGANITIDYGTPTKRGREVWGKLVPWGKRWRTGANRATHFTTDQDLIIGDLAVPAGAYTFYTIPEEEGGTLIINKQTGQTGTRYDPEQDLGRVPLLRIARPETVETFTIEVVEEDESATLRLRWDQSAFIVPLWVPEQE